MTWLFKYTEKHKWHILDNMLDKWSLCAGLRYYQYADTWDVDLSEVASGVICKNCLRIHEAIQAKLHSPE